MSLRCLTCGEVKPATDFYVSNKSNCKPCVRARVKARARANPEGQEYERNRAKRPERKALAKKVSRQWRSENPQAYRAQTALGNALRDGWMTKKPCEICGAKNVHAHHEDYSRPFAVKWLCPMHHHRLHAETGLSGLNKRSIEARTK